MNLAVLGYSYRSSSSEMIVLSSASQSPVLGALQNINIFACPLPDSKQMTLIRCVVTVTATCATVPLQVVVPVPRGASCSLHASQLPAFFDVLHQCFPRSVPISNSISRYDSAPDIPEDDVEVSMHDAHVKRSKPAGAVAEAASFTNAATLPNVDTLGRIESMDSMLKLVTPKLHASVRTLYPEFNFCVIDVPAGCEGTQYPVIVKLVHSRASIHALWIPLRATIPEEISAGTFEPSLASVAGADIVLFTVGSVRRSDWSGGGKTSEEAFEDMRHRFASGSFRR
jgi:hypothetical protein